MAFSSARISLNDEEQPERQGRKKVTHGTFTNTAGSTGGNIDTGLDKVDHIKLQYTGSAVIATAPAINETMPSENGSAMTIVTTADADGIWKAVGQKN